MRRLTSGMPGISSSWGGPARASPSCRAGWPRDARRRATKENQDHKELAQHVHRQEEEVAEAQSEFPPSRDGEPGEERSRERGDDERGPRRRRRRRGRRGEEGREPRRAEKAAPALEDAEEAVAEEKQPAAAEAGGNGERNGDAERRRRRRGRRGGRWRNRDGTVENGDGEQMPEGSEEVAEAMVEAAIESAEIPAAEPRYDEPLPIAVVAEPPAFEAVVEAAIESAAIPLVEHEPEPAPERELDTVAARNGAPVEAEPERELETVAAGNGAAAEAEPELVAGSRRAPPSVSCAGAGTRRCWPCSLSA